MTFIDRALPGVILKAHPGVEAIVLVGSVARGEEHPLSDLDVICLGNDLPEYELTVRDSRLMALLGKTALQAQADLLDPAVCAQAVPSWRITCRATTDPKTKALLPAQTRQVTDLGNMCGRRPGELCGPAGRGGRRPRGGG